MILAFQLIILLFSAVIHEVAHGLSASALGDQTARNLGRLTLNPLKHLDLFGSVILPITLFITSGGSFVFGFAKPVPFNPWYLKNPKRDSGIIAISGPASNLIIAIVIGSLIKLGNITAIPIILGPIPFLEIVVLINISLAIFNLVPIPPLDGSKILFAFLPKNFYRFEILFEKYGFFVLILFIAFGFRFLVPLIWAVFRMVV